MAARIPRRLISRFLSPAVGCIEKSSSGVFALPRVGNPGFLTTRHFSDDSFNKESPNSRQRRRRLTSPQQDDNDAAKASNPLDDFFVKLGNSSGNRRSPSSHERRRRRQASQFQNLQPKPHLSHKSSQRGRTSPHGSPSMNASIKRDAIMAKEEIKKVEMSSFFDEVNAILKKGEEKQKANEPHSVAKARPSLSESSSLQKSNRSQSGATAMKANDHTPVSILDLLPPAKSPRGPDAYEEVAFDKYSELLDTIIEGKRFLGKHTSSPLVGEKADAVVAWLKADEPIVKPSIPALEDAMQGGSEKEKYNSKVKETLRIDEKDNINKECNDVTNLESRPYDEQDFLLLKEQLRNDLSTQRIAFMEQQGWTKKQYETAMKGLRQMGHMCAKTASGQPVEIAWQKFLEAGYNMDKDMLETFLYVSSTFCSRDSALVTGGTSTSAFTFGKGGSLLDFLDHTNAAEDTAVTEKESNDTTTVPTFERKTADTATQVAFCKDILHGACEQSTSIRVRVLVSQGKAKEAERLLDSSGIDDLRLRTYDPVLQYYLEDGDASSALQLFSKMKKKETVLMRPETYIQLLACIAENGHFQKDATPIEGILELGYSVSSGPKLFDILASELADHSVEISSSSAKRLYNALQKGFNDHTLRPLHLLESLVVQNEPASSMELVASRVSLDSRTGMCPRTGVQLRLINLDSLQKSQLKDGLLYLSSVAYEERSGKKDSRAREELNKFGKWLETRPGDPFTAIVDGPNVAYYFQNFDGGTFNFHQIQFVVEALENMGENVLVILPKKYMQKSFVVPKVTGPIRQTVSKKEREIREKLLSSGKAYIVPPSLLDDYYWMYASICEQGTKFRDKEQYVPPGNAEGRWPGIRPMLVSNDQMRDHKLSLLEPRLFRRWYSNFIVNFTFSAFVGDQCVDKEIGFSTADFYSREIQGNTVKNIDRETKSTVWHFPVSDWGECESFCVRIPNN